MSEPFLAQIAILPTNFAPLGWALCNGQLMAISQNTALFSLLGTTYGGNGTSNFALPNLQGSVAIGAGQGIGLEQYDLGESGGTSNVTLFESEMPIHTHFANATTDHGNTTVAAGNVPATGAAGPPNRQISGKIYSTNAPNTQLNSSALSAAGGTQPHNNMQPYLALNYCIALQGIFPARS
jgi:microcystin-dependent protein